MFLDINVYGYPVHFGGETGTKQHELTWVHDCGDGCLVNLEDDPTEHVDLSASTDPQHVKIKAELGAALKRLNEGIFSPDRGEDRYVCYGRDSTLKRKWFRSTLI